MQTYLLLRNVSLRFSLGFLAVSLLSTVLTLGCARKTMVVTQAPDDYSSPIEFAAPKTLKAALAESSVYCEGRNCNPSVAFVLSLNDPGSSKSAKRCTGFLISPTVLITNSHCIPDSLKAAPEKCSSQIGVMFPAGQGYLQEYNTCSRLISFSKISDEHDKAYARNPDYAFIELRTASTRPPLTVTHEGIQDKEAVTTISIEPTSDIFIEGKMKIQTCHAFQFSEQLPEFSYSLARLVSLFGCKIDRGNSGSPVLNDQGEVAGIVHAGINTDKLEDVNDKEKRVALVTNLGCVALPNGIQSTKADNVAACATLEASEYGAKTLAKRSEELLSAAIQQVDGDPSVTPLSAWFKFQITNRANGSDVELQATPICLKPRQLWGEQVKANSEVNLPLETKTYEINYPLDSYFRKVVSLKEKSLATRTLSFDPDLFKTLPGPVGTLGPLNPKDLPKTFVSRLCSADELAK